jgi:hypothetical protein
MTQHGRSHQSPTDTADLSNSPNLLESQSQDDSEQNAVPANDTMLTENQTIATMRSDISELRATITAMQNQLAKTTKTASTTHDTFEKVDFIGMNDQIYLLKKQTSHLSDYQIDHETISSRLAQLENERPTTWATKDEMDKSITSKIKSQLKDGWKTTDTKFKTTDARFQALQARITEELQHLDDIAAHRETVVDELNNAFEVLRDELSNEVRENTMDELFDDLNHDTFLQAKIKALIAQAHDPERLQANFASILNSELEDVRTQIQSQVKALTTDGLETQLSVLVAAGIKEIDSVIKGTTDLAIEMVMKATRAERPIQAHTAPPNDPIPTVTPQRTFRGMNVRIDESPPPGPTAFKTYNQTEHDQHPRDQYHRNQDPHSPPTQRYTGYEDYGPNRSRTNIRDDEYHRREPEEFTRRDQEYFLKGYIEATLENLLEDHVIVWYKSVDSYCTLHNVPLLSFQQVGKGIDLYPADAPSEHRERFSRMLSIKLNQSSLIKDPIAKSIINARAGRDDGYGALYALLAASIPRLQIHKIVPASGSNKPPTWEPTVVNL